MATDGTTVSELSLLGGVLRQREPGSWEQLQSGNVVGGGRERGREGGREEKKRMNDQESNRNKGRKNQLRKDEENKGQSKKILKPIKKMFQKGDTFISKSVNTDANSDLVKRHS